MQGLLCKHTSIVMASAGSGEAFTAPMLARVLAWGWCLAVACPLRLYSIERLLSGALSNAEARPAYSANMHSARVQLPYQRQPP